MQSLSAHHFRLSRRALTAARDYRDEIELALGEVGLKEQINLEAPAGLLLIASDLGLCGDYNTRLVHALVEQIRQHAGAPLYCVGRRPRAVLARYKLQPQRQYAAPASVAGLPSLLLQLAQDMLDDLIRGVMGSLFVVSSRFEGAGKFSPVITQVLPVRSPRPTLPLRPTVYQSARRLAAVAVREYLYTVLNELLLDSLASEHGMRLFATESARNWLDDTASAVRRRLSASRRETNTQEVLDIVAGSRARQMGKQPLSSTLEEPF